MAEVAWKQLNNPAILADVERRSERHILLWNDVKEALQLANLLEPTLERSPEFLAEAPDMVERYYTVVVKCKFIALALLPSEEIEDLFEKHITGLFQMPEYYDVWERLKVKLLAMPLYEERDHFKKRLREALLRNQEFLTPDIMLQEGDSEQTPTVANWLRNYIAAVGAQPAETIKRSVYLTQNKNVQKLKPVARKNLEQLIGFFENLKLSSLTPAGLEERISTTVDGRPATFVEGRFEEIDPKALEVIAQLKQAGFFPAFSKDQIENIKLAYSKMDGILDKVSNAEEGMRALYKQDPKKLQGIIGEFLTPATPTHLPTPIEQVIAAFIVLAREGWMLKLLSEQNPVREEFVKYLRQEGKLEDVQAFNLAPTSPLSLGKFLKFVLVRRMRMPESDAAAVAVRIGNILRQAGKSEYFDMAYYDQASGRFRWKI